jgi:hypothetical protein
MDRDRDGGKQKMKMKMKMLESPKPIIIASNNEPPLMSGGLLLGGELELEVPGVGNNLRENPDVPGQYLGYTRSPPPPRTVVTTTATGALEKDQKQVTRGGPVVMSGGLGV